MKTLINGKWTLDLPEHRATRPEWKTGWEVKRLNALYEVVEECKMQTTLDPVVLDVGTEEGDMSGLLASWGCYMYLIEPNPRVWPNIKYIWEKNKLTDPLGMLDGFIGNESNTKFGVSWADWPESSNGDLISDHGFCNLSEKSGEQKVIKIDDMKWEEEDAPMPFTIINIDVEGSELEVLKGAERTLRETSPIIFVSIHPEFLFNMYNQYSADLFNYMWDLGYKHEILDFDHEWQTKFTKKQ